VFPVAPIITGITSNITDVATLLSIYLLRNLHLTQTVCAIRPCQGEAIHPRGVSKESAYYMIRL
jgi:hypothetical protein